MISNTLRYFCGIPDSIDTYDKWEIDDSEITMYDGDIGIGKINEVWYIGGITDENAREFSVKLDFLTPGLIGDGKELSVIGSHLSGRVYDAVIRGIRRGQIRTDGLITHTFPLEQWEQAMETPGSDPSAVKVMLVP